MNCAKLFSAVVLAGVLAACGRAPHEPHHAAPAVTYFGDHAGASTTPALASSGRSVVAVWTTRRGSLVDVFAASSADNGVRFGPSVRVNDVEGEAHVYGEDPPRVAMSSDGAILVTWPSDRSGVLGLRSAISRDSGRTFSASTSIGDAAVKGERGFQSVRFGTDGTAHVSWLDERRDPGTPHHMNAGNDWDPMHLMYAASLPNGGWTPEARLASNVCGCCKTAIAVASDGTVYVAFRNIYPGNLRDISFSVSRDGKTFSPPVRVSEDHWSINACPDDGPAMAIDRAGTVHIVWPTMVDGSIRFFHASTRDGRTFTRRQLITTLGTVKPAHPQLAVDRCGELVLVWDEAPAANRRVFYRRLTPRSDGGVNEGPAGTGAEAYTAAYPVLAATDDGLVIAWTEVVGNTSRVALRRLEDRACSDQNVVRTPNRNARFSTG